MMGVAFNDTCDAYCTLPEVTDLADCIQRWDPSFVNKLTQYPRIFFQSLLQVIEEIGQETRPLGRSCSVQQMVVSEFKSLAKGYLAMAKWARMGHVPTFEEYMEVGLVTAGMDDMIAYGFVGMPDIDVVEAFDWLRSNPKIIGALNVMFRTKNDMAGFEIEMSRGGVANGLNCYMKQHGVTKEEACRALLKMFRDDYKVVMEEFLASSAALPRQILLRAVALARTIGFFYKDGDGYTEPQGKTEKHMISLYVSPMPL